MRIRRHLILCKFILFLGTAVNALAQEPSSTFSLTPEQRSGINALAQNLQKELKKEKCSDSTCQVLIVSLALRSGETCSVCIFLSDSLAKALGELPGSPGVINRENFTSFMDRETLPSQYLGQEQTLVWISRELHASRVLFGTLDPQGDLLSLNVKVLRYGKFADDVHVSKETQGKLPMGDLADSYGFTPRQFFNPLPNRAPSQNGPEPIRVPPKGNSGFTLPSCSFMPNPSYTDAARHAKISGSLLVEAIVTVQGTVISPRIIRGLPYGLNESSLQMLKTWKCTPATHDGKPVAVLVPFEVTFRLY